MEQLAKNCKRAAGFAGTMRRNLVEMLDACGVHTVFQFRSTQFLFSHYPGLLHTTSLIKYPVFINEKNYTGYTPGIRQSALLTNYAYHIFPKEIKRMEQDFLLIPLGKMVAEVIKELVNQGKIPGGNCLFGFPHPSGANGHRKKQFQKAKPDLQAIVRKYAADLNAGDG